MNNRTIAYFTSLIQKSDKLKDKEKVILLLRLRRKTLEKIGKKYKVSGERVRQIESVALMKLIKKIYQLVLFDR